MRPIEDQPIPFADKLDLVRPIIKAFSNPVRRAAVDILSGAVEPVPFRSIVGGLNQRAEDGELGETYGATRPLPPSTVTLCLNNLMSVGLIARQQRTGNYSLTELGRTAYASLQEMAVDIDGMLAGQALDDIKRSLQEITANHPDRIPQVRQMIQDLIDERKPQENQ